MPTCLPPCPSNKAAAGKQPSKHAVVVVGRAAVAFDVVRVEIRSELYVGWMIFHLVKEKQRRDLLLALFEKKNNTGLCKAKWEIIVSAGKKGHKKTKTGRKGQQSRRLQILIGFHHSLAVTTGPRSPVPSDC